MLQHHNIKLPSQMPPQGQMHPVRHAHPYGQMNGSQSPHYHPQNPNIPPGWNGQRPPMPGYPGNMRPESPGVWGPGMNPNNMNPNMGGLPDISHTSLPDDILTTEQLQHRQAGMESLRKIHAMLLQDDPRAPPTDFMHLNMAQEDLNMYGNGHPQMQPGGPPPPHMGGPQHMGGPPQHMAPGGHMMGPGGHPIGPGGMMPPGHPHPSHPHHMGSPMGPGPGPLPPQQHMGPGGPMPPHMVGPPHGMEMGMYPGAPGMMHPKPPPPYQAPMAAPAPEAPPAKPSKSKKRKSTSTRPQSPHSLKSPKYQVCVLRSDTIYLCSVSA